MDNPAQQVLEEVGYPTLSDLDPLNTYMGAEDFSAGASRIFSFSLG